MQNDYFAMGKPEEKMPLQYLGVCKIEKILKEIGLNYSKRTWVIK